MSRGMPLKGQTGRQARMELRGAMVRMDVLAIQMMRMYVALLLRADGLLVGTMVEQGEGEVVIHGVNSQAVRALVRTPAAGEALVLTSALQALLTVIVTREEMVATGKMALLGLMDKMDLPEPLLAVFSCQAHKGSRGSRGHVVAGAAAEEEEGEKGVLCATMAQVTLVGAAVVAAPAEKAVLGDGEVVDLSAFFSGLMVEESLWIVLLVQVPPAREVQVVREEEADAAEMAAMVEIVEEM